MATFSQNNIQWLMLGNNTSLADSARAADLNALAVGEIGIFSASGAKLTNASTAGTRFMVAAENGDSPVVSETIDPADVKSVKKVVCAPAAQQVDVIGYNGTTGSIEVIADNVYMANVNLNQSLVSNHGGQYLKHAVYKSASSGATQLDIASGLTDSFIKNFKWEADSIVKAERLSDEAGLPLGTGTATSATIVATNGSKVVTGWADVDDATTNAAIAVGDLLRFGTATTDPVYKVESIDTTNDTLTLDVPYQGATETFDDSGLERIAAAAASASEMGVKITGVAGKFDTGKLHYYPGTSWELTLRDFGTTTLTNSVEQDNGKGTYEQIAELEFFLQGNGGNTMRTPEPLVYTRRAKAESGKFYNLYEISYTTKEERGYGAIHAPKQLTIAVNVGADGSSPSVPSWVGGTAGIEATLEQLLTVTL